MMGKSRYDVIVVGSGPSGAMTAQTCSKKGLKTLILEKEKLPRYKPCGGLVSNKALSLIGRIDNGIIQRECYGARVFFPDFHNFEDKSNKRIAVTVSRSYFDYFLTKGAQDNGTVVHDNEMVRDIRVSNSGVEVRTNRNKYKSELIIGADGVNSVVAKKTGIRNRWGSNEAAICIETEIEIGKRYVEQFMKDAELVELYFLDTCGYGWVFPKRTHLSVGIGGKISRLKNPQHVFNNFIRNVSLQKKMNLNEKIGKIHAHMIPIGGIDRTICQDRVMLVGDAAGFVDPFLGEGIYYALKSGELAGEVAIDAMEKNNLTTDFLSQYKSKCENEFNHNLKSALKFSNFAYNHLNIFLKALHADRDIFSKYFQTARGDISYGQFINYSILRSPITLLKMITSHV